jgi:electron transfer flavoprotein beta subunit
MKILVCISHVPDTNTKIQIDGSGKSIVKQGVTFVICPYDEFALARAAEFKEKNGDSVTLISVGGPEVDATLRKGLSVTGDAAVRVNAEPKDAFFVAKQIAEYARGQNFDLIMFGKESIDYNGSAVSGMVAEMLDMPDVSFATSIEVNGTTARLTREIDGGKEILECPLPLVLSAQKGLAEWRIPNIKGITAARSKPLTVVEPVSVSDATETVSLQLPPAKQGCQYLQADETDKLVQILAEKGAF